MKMALYLSAFLCLPLAMVSAGTDNHILEPANLDVPSMQMFNSSQSGTDLGFRLAGVGINDAELDGKTYQTVTPIAPDIEKYGETAEEGLPDLPLYAHLVGIPDQSGVRVEIVSSSFEIIEDYDIMPTQTPTLEGSDEMLPFVIDEDFYQRDQFYPSQVVDLGEPLVCRDLRMIQVVISPIQYNPVTRQLKVYTSIDYNLVYEGFDERNAKTRRSNRISESFLPLYRAMAPNADELLAAYEPVRGGYLILTPDVFEDTAAVLGRWKHLKGYDVVIASASDIDPNGSSPSREEVKSYIQNAYDTWDMPPEFVCIVGDIGSGIPHYSYSGYTSDHKYSLVDGSDYLSDIMVTRMSITNWTNLRVAMYKAIKYEREPYMGDPNYWLRGLSVAGNVLATTPRITVLWARSQLLNHGFYQVDTVFSWSGIPGHPNENPGPTPILNSMNNGVSIVSYRGWAGPSGWYNPSFSTSNLAQVQNNNKIGPMASIVCGTGDYGYSNDPCFGEKWIRMGASPTSFKGGPAFYGATDWDTHTKWNNPIMIGYYWGILEEGIYNFASAAYRGKIQLYNTFPLFTGEGTWVEQYFHTYNTLGDPELELRTAIPQNLTVTYPSIIPVGTNMLEIHVTGSGGSPLEGAYVNLLKGYGISEEVFVGGRTDSNGDLTLDFGTSTEDTLFVTVTARNYIPHTGYSLVETEPVAVGISAITLDDDNSGNSSGNNDGNVNPAETVEFDITLRNFGDLTTATNVQATLTSPSQQVNITVPNQNYGDISPGNTAGSGKFAASFADNIPHGDHIILELEIASDQGSWTAAVPIDIKSMYFLHLQSAFPDNPNNRLDPGETSWFAVQIQNIGELAGTSLTGVLTTSDPGINITDGSADFGDIGIGETGSNNSSPFTVEVAADVYNGHNVNFSLELTSSNGSVASRLISVVVGSVSIFDPVGPDNYGYYMYEDIDAGYDPAPLYDWVEISPYAGGPGTRVNFPDNTDDDATVVSLPFDFIYYGQSFDYMLVCINGFVALDTSTYDMGGSRWSNFHNKPIPDPAAPSGLIAPFWDDLIYSGNDGVFKYYDASAHRLIIEWKNCKHPNPGNPHSPETFQMIIYDPDYYPTPTGDSEILFQYQTVYNDDDDYWDFDRPGLYSTVGFQNLENNDGLQYTFDNIYHPGAAILEAGRAIKVTTATGMAPPPDIEYDPSSFFASAEVGQITTDNLHISNVGEGTLIFSLVEVANEPLLVEVYPEEKATSQAPIAFIETTGNKKGDRRQAIYPPVVADRGGPDAFGYEWIDSDEPGGPAYNWIDISLVGTPLNWPGNADDGIITDLPIGFDFPFYGNSYSTINVCTNGFASFTSTATQYNNGPIPDAAQPNNLLAVYWDDLNFETGGSAYFYTNNVDSCIVAYVDVPHYYSEGSYTFEVIMLGTGNIVYQYQEATGPSVNQETIGIENAAGTVGLQVAYNSAYVHDFLAVKIYSPVGWLNSDTHSGVLESGEDIVAVITFDATELEEGVYTGAIEITCNDPGESFINIPVTFDVGGQGTPDMQFSPLSYEETLQEGNSIVLDLTIWNNGTAELTVDLEAVEFSLINGKGDDDKELISVPVTQSESSGLNEPPEVLNIWLFVSPGSVNIPADDSFVAQVTFDATSLGVGMYLGEVNLTSNDPDTPTGTIPVTLDVTSGCAYIPGDSDENGAARELTDVVKMIAFYRGFDQPGYVCNCTEARPEYKPSADVDGNCVSFELTDVVMSIAAYRGPVPLSGCVDCPGQRRSLPGGDEPLVKPSLKSKISKGKTAE